MATKFIEALDDGREIETSKEGWKNDKDKDGNPLIDSAAVLFPGWKANASPHATPGMAFFLGVIEKLPKYKVGEYNGIPVVDAGSIFEDMANEYIEKYDIKVPKLARSSGAAAVAKQNLESIATDKVVMNALKKANPELWEKINRYAPQPAAKE